MASTSSVKKSLADQLRAQWGGNWNISGVDRAEELARILEAKGITSLDGLKIGTGRKRMTSPSSVLDEGGQEAPATYAEDGTYLDFGGTQIGNFGDQGKGNWQDVANSDGPNANEFGWSSAGDGAVGYSAVTGPDGKVQIVPNWNSSSDAAEARDVALKAAMVVGGGMLANGAGLGGASGSGAGTIGADAATSAAWSNGAGLGGDTLSAMGMGGGEIGAGGVASGLGGADAAGYALASDAVAGGVPAEMLTANGIDAATLGYGPGSEGAAAAAGAGGGSGGLFAGLPGGAQNALWNLGTKAATVGLLGAAGSAMAPSGPDAGAGAAVTAFNGNVANQQQGLADQQKALFAEYSPLIKDLIAKQVTAQDKNTARSDDAWADYNNIWRPVQNELAAKSLDWASGGRQTSAANEAGAEVAGQFDTARATNREQMIRAGLDPTAMAGLENAGRLDEAKASALAKNTARRDVEKTGMSYLDNAARFGTGLASLGMNTAQQAQSQGAAATAGIGNLSSFALSPQSPLNSAVAANTAASNASLNLTEAQRRATNDRNGLIGDTIGAGLNAIGQSGGWQNFFKGLGLGGG